MPRPATVEDEAPSLVSAEDERPAIPHYSSATPDPAPQTSSPLSSSEPTSFPSVNELQRGFEELLIKYPRISSPSSACPVVSSSCHSQPKHEVPSPSQHQAASSTEIPVTRGAAARDKWFAELAGVSHERQNAVRNNTYVSALSNMSIFSVYCNNCNQAIPDWHYHCSTCDDGDFDLCQTCIDEGVLCSGDDHWLIKRYVKNGQVINSTTEIIAPKPAALESKTTPVEPEEEALIATRTCNSCVQGQHHMEFHIWNNANIAFRIA